MKLGFDIDGIVADMAQSLIDHANEKYNLNHTTEIFVYHNIFKDEYTDDDALNEEIAQSIVDNVIHDEDAIYEVKPYKEAVEAVLKLKRQHSIHFITSRRKDEKRITIEWLRKCNIPFDSVHCTGSATALGESNKGMLGRSLNLDFYIDDQSEHLEAMYKFKERWHKKLALYTRPWNREEFVDNSKFVRVNNWKEITRHLGIHKR